MKKVVQFVSVLLILMLAAATALSEKVDAESENPQEISANELIEMIYEPENASLIGQRIRVNGYFDSSVYEEDGIAYYYLVIANPGSCCAEVIPYIPDTAVAAFPEYGTYVELTGLLERIDKDGYSSLRIVNALITWE